MVRALSTVDRCVRMRVFKHGYDKEYFIKDTEDIFSPLHPRKLCFSGLDNFPAFDFSLLRITGECVISTTNAIYIIIR